LRFIEGIAARISRHEQIKRRQRTLRFTDRFGGPGQLVQNPVGIFITGVCGEQRLVQLHGLDEERVAAVDVAIEFAVFTGRQIQIAESAHRLKVQRRIINRHVEKQTVLLASQRTAVGNIRLRLEFDLACLEITDALAGLLFIRAAERPQATGQRDRCQQSNGGCG